MKHVLTLSNKFLVFLFVFPFNVKIVTENTRKPQLYCSNKTKDSVHSYIIVRKTQIYILAFIFIKEKLKVNHINIPQWHMIGLGQWHCNVVHFTFYAPEHRQVPNYHTEDIFKTWRRYFKARCKNITWSRCTWEIFMWNEKKFPLKARSVVLHVSMMTTFWKTWKCQEIRQLSGECQRTDQKSGKYQEKILSGKLHVWSNISVINSIKKLRIPKYRVNADCKKDSYICISVCLNITLCVLTACVTYVMPCQ